MTLVNELVLSLLVQLYIHCNNLYILVIWIKKTRNTFTKNSYVTIERFITNFSLVANGL